MILNQKIKKIIIFFTIISQLLLLSSCALLSAYNNERLELTNLMSDNIGNTIGNLRNLGFMTNDNYYIYYMTFISSEIFLNRRSIINGESQVIDNGLFLYLNAVDGFIYYVNPIDNQIYRMDINGEQNERLSDIRVNDSLFVFNNTIYFLGIFEERPRSLYAMNIDGSNVRILSDNTIISIYFYNNKIYYTTLIDGQTLLYKMGLNGENKELVTQGEGFGNTFFVYKENIYFVGDFFVYKFDVSNQERSVIHIVDGMIPSTLINRKDNILFFVSVNPRTYHWINFDTNEVNTVSNINADTGFHIIGNRIFYYDSNEQIYSMNIDGSDRRRFN